MFQMTPDTETLIDRALSEDLSIGDPTTDILIPPDMQGKASFVAKQEGILAGLDVALAVFQRFDNTLTAKSYIQDGERLRPDDLIATVSGRMNPLLKSERTALNFIRMLSGTATVTAEIRARSRWIRRTNCGYAQNDSRTAGAREVRRQGRRRLQPQAKSR